MFVCVNEREREKKEKRRKSPDKAEAKNLYSIFQANVC